MNRNNSYYINKEKEKEKEKEKLKENYKGIWKCNVKKYNVDLFIIKIFLNLTGVFPIAQNILLTNSEEKKQKNLINI